MVLMHQLQQTASLTKAQLAAQASVLTAQAAQA